MPSQMAESPSFSWQSNIPLSTHIWASQVVHLVKNLPAHAGETRDLSSVPGSGRSSEVGNGNSLQYSCLEKLLGQQSLAGYSLWSCREQDRTEQLKTHTHTRISIHLPRDEHLGYFHMFAFVHDAEMNISIDISSNPRFHLL